MTAPRQVVARTYLVTRRCAQRQFLLKPSRTTDQVFLYLSLSASRYGIEIHAFCVLSMSETGEMGEAVPVRLAVSPGPRGRWLARGKQ